MLRFRFLAIFALCAVGALAFSDGKLKKYLYQLYCVVLEREGINHSYYFPFSLDSYMHPHRSKKARAGKEPECKKSFFFTCN